VFVVFEKETLPGAGVVVDQEGGDRLIGGRLTLEAAVSLCKLGPMRYWRKVVATKEVGPSRFDNAKQLEKQHGTEAYEPAQAG
jgi:hypothetical protein